MPAQIQVEKLEKRFWVAERRPGMLGAVRGLIARRQRELIALHGVSFAIEPGEVVGYIGPNGAGKSTTIKILAGILTPSGGRCTVDGRTPWRDRIEHVARIGVVFGQRSQLWWDLPVVPLACVVYFPGVAILGVQDPLGTTLRFQLLAPLAGWLFFASALLVWQIGVRRYTSTGN
jgi:ABC-type uncharacterized transport system ATPase subunit